MKTPTPDSFLAPEPQRALRRRMVALVMLSTFAAAALPGVLWTRSTYGELRERVDEAGPLALERSVEGLRSGLAAAEDEIAWLAGRAEVAAALPASGSPSRPERVQQLGARLEASEGFVALLLLDPSGKIVARAGSHEAAGALAETLEPRRAIESELSDAMRGAQLRRELGGVTAPGTRLLDLPSAPALLVSAPVRADGGRVVATLHGILGERVLATRLRSELLGPGGRVLLVDGASRSLARSATRERPEADLLSALLGPVGEGWSLRHSRPMDRLGCAVLVEQPMLLALGPLARTALQAAAVPILLAVCFGLLAFRSATRMVRPLWALYASMRRAAREETPEELSVGRTRGEAGSLIEAYNAMTRRLLERKSELELNNRALRDQNQAFQVQHASLSKLSLTDSLTQLANRRFFEEQLAREVKRLSRNGEGLSMMVLDIDDFKQLNDRHGHAAGDEFLRQVAKILSENVRATDLVARYGGEEFVVVATGTDVDGAVVLAEKLRTSVAEASFIVDETMRPRSATISVGVAQYRGSQTDLFNSADAALYEAKAAGKNCVCAARDAGE